MRPENEKQYIERFMNQVTEARREESPPTPPRDPDECQPFELVHEASYNYNYDLYAGGDNRYYSTLDRFQNLCASHQLSYPNVEQRLDEYCVVQRVFEEYLALHRETSPDRPIESLNWILFGICCTIQVNFFTCRRSMRYPKKVTDSIKRILRKVDRFITEELQERCPCLYQVSVKKRLTEYPLIALGVMNAIVEQRREDPNTNYYSLHDFLNDHDIKEDPLDCEDDADY